ncbi:MAG: glutamate formimidoyltransferase [Chloroflexi bacterium]|nr:glutamate formimidoyltransferase [Chloroflexota bacterium]
MAGYLVECVPNVSEGRRQDVLDQIQAAIQEVKGVAVLDRHADPIHNRAVFTFAGEIGAVAEAAFRLIREAAATIDLRTHRGVHPRIGAADVVPFVPIGETPMAVCVELARRVGRRVGAELDLPVFLYGEAAQDPSRKRLADVRRGEYEGLVQSIVDDALRRPDFGPSRLGPAGATAIGARPFLVAYNVNLRTPELATATAIARAIRESSGGLPAVQARGFATADPAIQQVSTNVLDTARTPLHVLFAAIEREASARGATVVGSELVGLVPTAALADVARDALRFEHLDADATIESRLLSRTFERWRG